MNINKLNWDNFDWREFQILCIEIARTTAPDCSFKEYLNPGHKQEGIDLIAFKRNNGKFFTIQCKKEKKLTKADLIKILLEFEKGKYFESSSDFVIATSADLQSTELQTFINVKKLEYFNKHKIILDCWDVSEIETHLKNKFYLVEKYFGVQQAENFCYHQIRYERLQKFNAVDNYIQRRLSKITNDVLDSDFSFRISPIVTFELYKIITKNRIAKRICVVGDAYQGKSSLIRQTLYEIQKESDEFQLVLLQLKDYNVQPISNLLSVIYGEWRNIPSRDIILFIDGVDEVSTEKFSEMIHHIKEFALSYCDVSIIFSCRTLFYNKYNIESIISDFETYELFPLQHSDVNQYIQNNLGALSDNFYSAASIAGVSNLLFHPFYLVHIIDEYTKPPHILPTSKIKVIDSLINRAFHLSKYRKIKGSNAVIDETYSFSLVIEKFALSLQLAGKNSFDENEMTELFNSEERLLLQHNSLVSKSNTHWSFINALFQEHIAGKKLSKIAYEEILAFTTVGHSFRKIKTKWIQTISSLLSITEDPILFDKLFKLFENDNIELLFQTESSKYENELKLVMLKKLINRFISLSIRSMIVHEETIGHFIRESDPCKKYLLNLLVENTITKNIKVVCCRILRSANLSLLQQKRYFDFAISELKSCDDVQYAANLIEVFSFHNYGDNNLIETLISIEKLNSEHEYRNAVYELITSIGAVDEFYDYGLQGFSALMEYNKVISHGGSEYNLEKLLLSAAKPVNLCKLIRCTKNPDWMNYYGRHSITGREFFKQLFNKLATVYESYPYLIFSIAELFTDLENRYVGEIYRDVDIFLDKTGTHWLMVRILINEIFKSPNWEIGSFINRESYDYLMFEFEESEYEIRHLWNCIHDIRHNHKDLGDKFYQLSLDATEGRLINKEDSLYYQDYLKAESIKHENDLKYIQSKDAFKKGVTKYFKAYGKNSIDEDDLFIDNEPPGILRQSVDSYFIYYFLLRWQTRSPRTLKDSLSLIDKHDFFDTFRIQEIKEYHIKTDTANEILLPIVEDYYNRKLSEANFTNCIWMEEDGYKCRKLEYRLGELFRQYKFETPENYLTEFVWLDIETVNGIEDTKRHNRQSISLLILERLSPSGKINLKNKIIRNIKNGIKHDLVLATHVSLCKYLKITEAKDFILEHIKNFNSNYTLKTHFTDTYLDLGGDLLEILAIFMSYKNYNNYLFHFFIQKLSLIYPNEVSLKLRESLFCHYTNIENKIINALSLAEIGDIDAFKFLVNEVRMKKHLRIDVRRNATKLNVDTLKALDELADVIYLLLDKTYNTPSNFKDTPRDIILEWLYLLAAKSEKDLLQVITFLEKKLEELTVKYSNASDLNWYINRMLENFRSTNQADRTISEIKKILLSID